MARKNWITALACCALLALGACTHSDSDDEKVSSGGGPPPAEGSVAAADLALTNAMAAVAAAETAFKAAVLLADGDSAASDSPAAVSQADDDSAAPAPMTPRDTARKALETADKALEAAVAAADAAVKAAGDDAAKKKLADAAKESVDDYKAKNPLKLVKLTVDVWDAKDAVDAAGDDVTATQRTTLKTAQAALNEAVEEMEAGALKTALSKVVDDADELRKSLAWATGKGLEPSVTPKAVDAIKIDVHRTPRTKVDGSAADAADRLAIVDKAVAWANGKMVISPDGDGSTDELPLRAVTVRELSDIQGDDKDLDGKKDNPAGEINNKSGNLKSSIQITDGGVVLKVGGDGVWYDMQSEFSTDRAMKGFWNGKDGHSGTFTTTANDSEKGDKMTAEHAAALGLSEASGRLTEKQAEVIAALRTTGANDNCWKAVTCGNFLHDDLTITFDGNPSQSDDGSAVWYAHGRVDLPDGTDVSKLTEAGAYKWDMPQHYLTGKPNQDLGEYHLWISNYAGFDEGKVAYDKDGKKLKDQGSFADGDHSRYLSYAAYGLFHYVDNIVERPWITRSQAFHFGYDAAVPEAKDDKGGIQGTFKGYTMAHVLNSRGYGNSPGHFTDVDRLRGEVVLKAVVNSGENTISGSIENLEHRPAGGGVWAAGNTALAKVNFVQSTIGQNGSYKGVATAERHTSNDNTTLINVTAYGSGHYDGNFYGPEDGLETAGWWHLGKGTDRRVIIGSYGAVAPRAAAD